MWAVVVFRGCIAIRWLEGRSVEWGAKFAYKCDAEARKGRVSTRVRGGAHIWSSREEDLEESLYV